MISLATNQHSPSSDNRGSNSQTDQVPYPENEQEMSQMDQDVELKPLPITEQVGNLIEPVAVLNEMTDELPDANDGNSYLTSIRIKKQSVKWISIFALKDKKKTNQIQIPRSWAKSSIQIKVFIWIQNEYL